MLFRSALYTPWSGCGAGFLKKELMEAMRSLAYSPNRFPFLNEPYIPCNKYHKMFVKNWYLILYQIEDDTVYVDYILDCRKEYNWLIR